MQIFIFFLLIFSYMYFKISRDSFLIMKEGISLISKIRLLCSIIIYLITICLNFSNKKHRYIFVFITTIISILMIILQKYEYLPNILHYLLTDLIGIIINVSFWSIAKNKNVLYGSAIATCFAGFLQYFQYFNIYISCIILFIGNILLLFQPIIINKEEENVFQYQHLFLLAFFINCFTGCIDMLAKNVLKSYSTNIREYNQYTALFWITEGFLSLLLLIIQPLLRNIYIMPISQFFFIISKIFSFYSIIHALINKIIKHNIFNIIKRANLYSTDDLKYASLFAKYGKYSSALVILFFCDYIYSILFIIACINMYLSYKVLHKDLR